MATSGGAAAPAGFTASQFAGVLGMTLITGAITSLQPMLLGLVASQGRLTMEQIGHAATLEALGMAAATSAAGVWLKPVRLKLVALVATVMLLAANVISMTAAGYAIMAARVFGGLSSGLIIWIYVGLLARTATPARIAGSLSVVQGLLALTLTSILSTVLVPRFGGGAGYGALVVMTLLMFFAVPLAPSAYAPVIAQDSPGRMPGKRGLLGLVVVFLQLSAILGTWVYALPLGRESGLTEIQAGLAISAALGFQIAGGLSSAVFARRFSPGPVLMVGLIGGVLAVFLMTRGLPWTFLLGAAVLCFLWMGTTSFQMPFLIEIDPSRRAALQLVAAQLLGVAAGPTLTSFLVTPQSAHGAALASGALYALGAVLAFWLIRTNRNAGPAA